MVAIGDLIKHVEDKDQYGLVLRVIDDVEIPPLIEVLWVTEEKPVTSRVYADDLIIVNKNVKDNATVI